MSIPTHYDCTTRMWPMQCKGCKQWIFFLTCSCGSKVLLDQPHPPWPRHGDSCMPTLIQEARNINGWSARQMEDWLARKSNERGVALPAEMRRLLAASTNKETGRTTVMLVVPSEDVADGERVVVTAEVYEVDSANIFKRSGTATNIVGKKILEAKENGLGFEPLVDLKLRGHRDPDTGFKDEYPVIALKETWENSGLAQHEIARVTFKKIEFFNGYRIWFVEKIERSPR